MFEFYVVMIRGTIEIDGIMMRGTIEIYGLIIRGAIEIYGVIIRGMIESYGMIIRGTVGVCLGQGARKCCRKHAVLCSRASRRQRPE